MTRKKLIERTLKSLSKLPQDRLQEVYDFADYILKKHDEELMQKGIEELVSTSKAYKFLNDEEDLYTLEDLKEKY